MINILINFCLLILATCLPFSIVILLTSNPIGEKVIRILSPDMFNDYSEEEYYE